MKRSKLEFAFSVLLHMLPYDVPFCEHGIDFVGNTTNRVTLAYNLFHKAYPNLNIKADYSIIRLFLAVWA